MAHLRLHFAEEPIMNWPAYAGALYGACQSYLGVVCSPLRFSTTHRRLQRAVYWGHTGKACSWLPIWQ